MQNHNLLHSCVADELWHFYLGAPLTVIELDPHSKQLIGTQLGHDLKAGQRVQHTVKGGRWFGAFFTNDYPSLFPLSASSLPSSSPLETSTKPTTKHDFSLVGCTVSPGFHFDDFELSGSQQRIEWERDGVIPQEGSPLRSLFNQLCPPVSKLSSSSSLPRSAL